jgi:acyl-CoA reductase-like NAD-dependent aldehyde dehydrogenase
MADTLTAPANYIAGEWRPSAAGDTYEKRNPARPDELVGEFPSSAREDVDLAVEAAAAALPGWSRGPIAKRAAVLSAAAALIDERAEAIAQDMTREMGKPLREARMEAARAAQILRYSAGEAFRPVGELFQQAVTGGPVYTVHRAVGVVGLITPWNFPAAIPVWKLAPALIYGNTIVLKLAQDSPLTGLHIVRAFDDAGLPPGVLNVVIGRGSAVGTPLVEHPGVRALSFTGSVPVGEGIRETAGRLGKRVQLELGGHNPGAFWSAGQKCTATRRIYVQDGAYDAFRDAFLARVEAGKVGDPSDPDTEVGPLVNESAMDDVLGAIERGRSEGGSVLAGGSRGDDEAFLVAPTVFEDVADDATLSCEEVFGPVTSLYRFGDLDEALARANAVEFGLSAALFTNSLAATQQFVEQAEAGILHVNSQTAGADVHVPFGGVKGSGFGPHEQGRAAREFYTEVVTVYQDA